MRTITKTYDIFPLAELSATARETAYTEWLRTFEYSWSCDNRNTLDAFESIFNIKVTDWGYPCGAGQMREQERRTDAFLLPRGRAALDFTRRQGYGHGVAPWLPFLLLRCVGIRQRYGGKTAQQPIR